MDIKPPPSSGQATTTSNTQGSATPTTELPPSLQQLPRGTLLTAVVQSSTPIPTQQPQSGAATPQTLNQILAPGAQQSTAESAKNPAQSTTTAQARTYNVLLNISGNQIQTQSNSAFTVGQLLKVELTVNAGLRVVEVTNKNLPIDQTLLQLQQGLRQALPLQQSPKLLLNNLVPLFQLLQQSPNNAAKAQIRELLATIPDLRQLTNATTLKNSINQSGAFLEAKIKLIQGQVQQLQLNNQPSAAQTKQNPQFPGSGNITPPPTTVSRKTLTALNQQALLQSQPLKTQQSSTSSSASSQSASPQTLAAREYIQNQLNERPQLKQQLERLISQDFKAQLLKLSSTLLPLIVRTDNPAAGQKPIEAALLQRILQVLPQTSGGTSSSSTASGSSTSNLPLSNLPINTQLLQLLSPALNTTQPQAAQQQSTSSQGTLDLGVSTVLRQIAASLAQVQANQLQSLVVPRADIDGGQLLNSWNIEIPVFLEGQFKPIQLQINEERNPDSSDSNNEKQRIWKITLGFDFEELGEFYATLKIIDNSVSATFWSEKPETLQRITNELQHLNKSLQKIGLHVEELECRRGKPSLKETRLDQQLVDIKT